MAFIVVVCSLLVAVIGGSAPQFPNDVPCHSSEEEATCIVSDSGVGSIAAQLPGTTRRLELEVNGSLDIDVLTLLKPLNNLIHLTIVKTKRLGTDSKIVLDADTFSNHTNIKVLELNLPLAVSPAVAGHVFEGFTHLETLNLSFTQTLGRRTLDAFLESVSNCPLRKLLLRNFQFKSHDLPVEATKIDFGKWLLPLRHAPLEYLDLSFNGLQSLDVGLIQNAPHLRWLDVSNNLLLQGTSPVVYWDVWLHPSLEVVHASNQAESHHGLPHRRRKKDITVTPFTLMDILPIACPHMKTLPKSPDLQDLNETVLCDIVYCLEGENVSCNSPLLMLYKYVKPGCDYGFQLPLGPNLKEIHYRNIGSSVIITRFQLSTQCFYPNNSLQVLDMADNPGLADIMNSLDIQGLHVLRRLNLDNIGFEITDSSLLDDFPELIELHIAGNRVKFTGAKRLLKYNDKLEKLDLSKSIVGTIPRYEFSRLNRLQELNLSHNGLQDLDFEVSNLTSLRLLDISHNSLKFLRPGIRAAVDKLERGNHTLNIDLRGNPLLCTCDTLDFVKWLQQPNHKFVNVNDTLCFQTDLGSVTMAHVDTNELDNRCFPPSSPTKLLAGVYSGGVFAVVAGLFLLRKRLIKVYWSFRHWIYRLFGPKYSVAPQNYAYDAVILYSSDDKHFVHDVLCPEMEKNRELKLYMYLRDMLSGEAIPASIGEAINKARKTVIVLSPNFLSSDWCQFDMHMAELRLAAEGLDVSVPIIYKPLPLNGINEAVARLLQTHDAIKWKDDPDGQLLFFDELQYKLTTEPKRPLRK